MFGPLDLLAEIVLGSAATRVLAFAAPAAAMAITHAKATELNKELELGINNKTSVSLRREKDKAKLKLEKAKKAGGMAYSPKVIADLEEAIEAAEDRVDDSLSFYDLEKKDYPVFLHEWCGRWLITPQEKLLLTTFFNYKQIARKGGAYYEKMLAHFGTDVGVTKMRQLMFPPDITENLEPIVRVIRKHSKARMKDEDLMEMAEQNE